MDVELGCVDDGVERAEVRSWRWAHLMILGVESWFGLACLTDRTFSGQGLLAAPTLLLMGWVKRLADLLSWRSGNAAWKATEQGRGSLSRGMREGYGLRSNETLGREFHFRVLSALNQHRRQRASTVSQSRQSLAFTQARAPYCSSITNTVTLTVHDKKCMTSLPFTTAATPLEPVCSGLQHMTQTSSLRVYDFARIIDHWSTVGPHRFAAYFLYAKHMGPEMRRNVLVTCPLRLFLQ